MPIRQKQFLFKTGHSPLISKLVQHIGLNTKIHTFICFRVKCHKSEAQRGPLPVVVVVEVLFYVHRNSRIIRTVAQDGHLDFHTAPEFCMSGGVYVPCLGLCACVASFER